jgi:hypothetical protein
MLTQHLHHVLLSSYQFGQEVGLSPQLQDPTEQHNCPQCSTPQHNLYRPH